MAIFGFSPKRLETRMNKGIGGFFPNFSIFLNLDTKKPANP